MITSKNNLFSEAQAVTVSAASTNIIDLGTNGTPYGYTNALTRDLGREDDGAEIEVSVSTTFATLTSLAVSVQTSPDNSTWTTVVSGTAIAAATLVAGYQFKVPAHFPEGTNTRYVRLYYTVAGSNATAGAINAYIVPDRQTNLSFGGQ